MLTTVRILEAHGLKVFDVEELPTHGGSLRVYACRAEDQTHDIEPSVRSLIAEEEKGRAGFGGGLREFARQVKETKLALVDFLLAAARQGKSVAGYGAPGKSATLLHYCGIGKDLIEYTVDRSPYKQGRFLPGSHIPIYHPGPDSRDQAGLCRHPALEPERRNHGAVAVHSGVGRPIRRADPESDDLLEARR